jgi:hypothetical protein
MKKLRVRAGPYFVAKTENGNVIILACDDF